MPPNYAGALSQQQQQGNGNGNGNGNGKGKGKDNSSANTNASQMPLTPTAMGRWSVASKQLPPVEQIKALHVYDFDNTREHPNGCSSSPQASFVAR